MNTKKKKPAADGLAGKVLNVAELVAYGDGAVISRAVVKKEAGNVTLFAFATGEGLSEHVAPFDALVVVLDGETEITLSGKKHRVRVGEMLLMPAGAPHALKAVTAFKMMLVMIKSKD